MKKVVVSYADCQPYLQKLERQKRSIHQFAPGVDHLIWNHYQAIGCMPHSIVPYQFKPYCIDQVRRMGYELVLWIDSPIHATQSLDPVWEYLEENKYMFFDNIGHSLGRWTNDKALDFFNMSREEALDVKMIMACCMGFNFTDPTVREVFAQYRDLSDDLYPGSWSNHRHDQTVMSFLIHKHGLNIEVGQDTFFAYRNHHGVLPIADSVCLISE